jgi:hypothetical protein
MRGIIIGDMGWMISLGGGRDGRGWIKGIPAMWLEIECLSNSECRYLLCNVQIGKSVYT